MEHRDLGRSGVRIPVLSFGTTIFGRVAEPTAAADQKEADRLIGQCMDAGITLFDTADIYGLGRSEETLGRALASRRNRVLIATKGGGRTGPGPDEVGASRRHLMEACNASLRRLGTDHIDLYQMHAFDALTPLDETLAALDELVRSGKVRYIGASNYAGWQLMKALAISEKNGLARFVCHQVSYSLLSRDVEHEIVPAGLDQKVALMVASPLARGLLSGKFRRGVQVPSDSRGLRYLEILGRDQFDAVTDVIADIAEARGVSISQVALNYILGKPGVTSIVVGPRNDTQLKDCLGATSWHLTADESGRLDAASRTQLPYPLSHQRSSLFVERNPEPRRS